MITGDELFGAALMFAIGGICLWVALRGRAIICRNCERQVCQCGYLLHGLPVDRGMIQCPECGRYYRRKPLSENTE